MSLLDWGPDGSLSWAQPQALLLLPVWLLWLFRRWRQPTLDESPVLLHPGLPDDADSAAMMSAAVGHRILLLRALAGLCLIFALAQPRQSGGWITSPAQGRDLALVLDVSHSMALGDLGSGEPRLQVMQRLLDDFLSQRDGDRIGLFIYGSQAAELSAPTQDLAHLRRQLQRLTPGLLGNDTATGDALGLALQRLRHRGQTPALLLIGDGDTGNTGLLQADEALALIRAGGFRVHALQLGAGPPADSPATAPDAAQTDMHRAAPAQPGYADLARLSGGLYAQATRVETAAAFLQRVAQVEPIRHPAAREPDWRERNPPLIAAALILLALAAVLARREGDA